MNRRTFCKSLVALLAVSLLPTPQAFAITAQTQYVTQGCANNGNGTAASCAGSPGGAGAYNTFANWESQNRNLVTEDVVLTAQFSGTFTTAGLTLAGWTTDATRKITLTGFTTLTTEYSALLTNQVNNVTLTQCDLSKNGASTSVVHLSNQSFNFTLDRCRIHPGNSLTRDSGNYIVENIGVAASSGTTIFRNNLFYNCLKTCLSAGFDASETLTVEANTVYDSDEGGIDLAPNGSTASTVNLYNNLVQVTATTDYSGSVGLATYNHATNLSEDTTSPDSSFRSKTVSFVNTGTGDFHIASPGTNVAGLGTTRAGVTVDYYGTSRGSPPTIGAAEFPLGGYKDPMGSFGFFGL